MTLVVYFRWEAYSHNNVWLYEGVLPLDLVIRELNVNRDVLSWRLF